MKLIIPMAGLGSRFQKVADMNPEFRKPKPFISVRGLPMVRWATGSLPFVEHPGQRTDSPLRVGMEDLIFLVLAEHDRVHGLTEGLKQIYSNAIRVIVLPALTRGASETVYQAKLLVDPEEEIIVTDSDHFFDGRPFAEAILAHREAGSSGVIPTFVPPNDGIPRWSYSLIEEGTDRITKVGEKDRELMEAGARANIGAYYFRRAGDCFRTFERVERENKLFGEEGKREFYVAPLYQELIEAGHVVHAAMLPEVWGLGTPADLEYFLTHCPKLNPSDV